MVAQQNISVSPWAITTIIALVGVLFGSGWLIKAAWTYLRAIIREDLCNLFETKTQIQAREDKVLNRIASVEDRIEETENVVNTKLIGAVESFTVAIAKIETLHDERHKQTQTTLHEIRDELRNLRKDKQ